MSCEIQVSPCDNRLGDFSGDRSGGAAFHAEGVDLAYDGAPPVFRSLALSARRGEILTLPGPSGWGKATPLNPPSVFLPPDPTTH